MAARWTATLTFVIVTISRFAIAQTVADEKPPHLIIGPASIATSSVRAVEKSLRQSSPQIEPVAALEPQPLLKKVTDALGARPRTQATGTLIGSAAVALRARSHERIVPLVFVGVGAFQLATARHVRLGWRSWEIHPRIARRHFSVTVRKRIQQ
jgi:hypothetical protein